ncbi:MAG TPA: hypothetical protein VGH15_11460 [Caulobacteraceae bacterium]
MDRMTLNRIAAVGPVILSLAALALVIAAVTLGWERGETDEGAVAHTWQLLIAAQAPLVVGFLMTADWAAPGRAARTLALQAAALIAALAPVALLRL